ncbi:MAG: cell division protein ZapA [Francisellaceae bacterium]|nr:cell division protein ZapA [Francisellaceae bacterium]
MITQPPGVSVKILSKEFQVACPKGSEAQLFDAAQYLDNQMREIRNTGKVIGTERIAVMAALNIAHELLSYRQQKDNYVQHLSDKLQNLQNKIDNALINKGTSEFA